MTQPPAGPNVIYRGPGASGSQPRFRAGRDQRAIGPQLVQLVVVLFGLLVIYEGAIWYWNTTAPKEVTIPKVSGLREEEATSVLRTTGLVPEIVARKYDEGIAEGIVLATDPKPGRQVKAGRAIRLTVSMGSRWSKVPEVGQMSVDRAKALLHEARLTVGKEGASYHDKIPIGYVISQEPQAGTRVIRNTPVNVVVSRGPEPPEEANFPQNPTGLRFYDVEFLIPPGPSLQDVRIVVLDSAGEHEVYHQSHQVGETVRKRVSGQGPDLKVQIYVSGNLAEEHAF